MFGCRTFTQSDSLEHYAGCCICVGLLRTHLHYSTPINRGHLIVLGVNDGVPSIESLVKLSLWVYTLYRTFNILKHRAGVTLVEAEVEGLMVSALWEGVTGYPQTKQFLSNCWQREAKLIQVHDESTDSDTDDDWIPPASQLCLGIGSAAAP